MDKPSPLDDAELRAIGLSEQYPLMERLLLCEATRYEAFLRSDRTKIEDRAWLAGAAFGSRRLLEMVEAAQNRPRAEELTPEAIRQRDEEDARRAAVRAGNVPGR